LRARAFVRAFSVMLVAMSATVYLPARAEDPDPTPSPTLAPSPTASAQPAGRRYERLSGPDRIATAVTVARATYASAPAAVLVSATSFADALVAAPLAAHLGGPILLTSPDRVPEGVEAALRDLGVRHVVLLGGHTVISESVEAELRESRRVGRVGGLDRYDTAARVAALLPASDEVFLVTGVDFADGLTAGPLAATGPHPILLTLPDELPEVAAARLERRDPARVTIVGGTRAVAASVEAGLQADGRTVRRLSGPSRHATALAVADAGLPAGLGPSQLWLADATRFPDALASGPAVAATGGVLLLVDGSRLSAVPAVGDWLRAHKAELGRVVFLGGTVAIAGGADAQFESVLAGLQLPRGGRSLLPEHRLVALYGHSTTPALGVLGEQPPDAAADRAVRVAQPFEAGGKPVLPAFEFIATVATAGPGPSGLYRAPTDPAVIRRSLEAIRRVQGYLVLDIQPGRSDFLTESRRYEALLAEPDVGLALDPEWRLGPDQRPNEQVGSVHASEVNAVSAWLADLVARHALPEKLLLLHQFQDQMIRERHLLEAREGLAITIQMDGFGSRAQKLGTYSRTKVAAPFFNGFKLFYDEDVNLYAPHEALGIQPVPDWFSYQ
jgi:putative cell wall-binding protein